MNHYKGRTTFDELLNMPNRMFHTLYIRLLERLSTDEGQAAATYEKLEETLEGG